MGKDIWAQWRKDILQNIHKVRYGDKVIQMFIDYVMGKYDVDTLTEILDFKEGHTEELMTVFPSIDIKALSTEQFAYLIIGSRMMLYVNFAKNKKPFFVAIRHDEDLITPLLEKWSDYYARYKVSCGEQYEEYRSKTFAPSGTTRLNSRDYGDYLIASDSFARVLGVLDYASYVVP